MGRQRPRSLGLPPHIDLFARTGTGTAAAQASITKLEADVRQTQRWLTALQQELNQERGRLGADEHMLRVWALAASLNDPDLDRRRDARVRVASAPGRSSETWNVTLVA